MLLTTTVVLPPNAKPAVCNPAPPKARLAVVIAVLATQEVPSYSSVFATLTVVSPPAASPAVCVPAPPKFALAVAKFPPLAQAPQYFDNLLKLQ